MYYMNSHCTYGLASVRSQLNEVTASPLGVILRHISASKTIVAPSSASMFATHMSPTKIQWQLDWTAEIHRI
jgi:hypothetical protein